MYFKKKKTNPYNEKSMLGIAFHDRRIEFNTSNADNLNSNLSRTAETSWPN